MSGSLHSRVRCVSALISLFSFLMDHHLLHFSRGSLWLKSSSGHFIISHLSSHFRRVHCIRTLAIPVHHLSSVLRRRDESLFFTLLHSRDILPFQKWSHPISLCASYIPSACRRTSSFLIPLPLINLEIMLIRWSGAPCALALCLISSLNFV